MTWFGRVYALAAVCAVVSAIFVWVGLFDVGQLEGGALYLTAAYVMAACATEERKR